MIPGASRLAGISESLLAATGAPDLGQATVLDETANRPWPLPDGPWLMAQTWRDLLFVHWPVAPETLRAVLPEAVPVDTYDGQAWIGVTPFAVSGLRLRGLPPLPGMSRFPELNVRTYSTVDGKPGIYFLSLDAGSQLAVLAARRAYRLPYFRAAMRIDRDDNTFGYASRRTSPDGEVAEFEATYQPTGEARKALSGSLEYFLTERYCLYTLRDDGALLRADIQHPPWPLQPATATILRNSMTRPWRIPLPDAKPLLHFSGLQHVVIWPLQPVAPR